MDLKTLFRRSLAVYGPPPKVGHAVPVMHVQLDDGAHWLPIRQHFIGGSEAADALGVGYKTPRQLARLKLGRDDEFAGNYQTRRGTWMEEFALIEFETATGRDVQRVPWVLRHPAELHRSCNLDALIDSTHVGEVKCPGDYVTGDLARLADGVPVDPTSAVGRYVIQCNHNMSVCGLESAWLIVLPGTRDPIFIELARNEALCDALSKSQADLWALIEQGHEPPPRAGDLRDLAKQWRAAHLKEVETDDARLVELLDEFDAIREHRREAEAVVAEYEAVEAEHKARIADLAITAGAKRVRVLTGGKPRTISIVEPRAKLDADALKSAHPDIHARFCTSQPAPYLKVT